jgi:hypothetical protein
MRFRGGDVQGKAEDELETIDGREPRASAAAPGESIALPSASPQVDYPELMTVERRHYMISGEIAQGGMGRVLAARDLRLGRAVAIKELLPRRDERTSFEIDSPIRVVAVARDGTVVAGREDSRVTLAHGGVLTSLVDHVGTVRAAAYSPDGSRLVTSSDDGDVVIRASGRPALRLAHDKQVRGDVVVRLTSEPPGNR